MTLHANYAMRRSMMHAATESVEVQNVSRETSTHFAEYVALLLKWNAKINLIGATTESDIWSRHIEDSSQLLSLIPKDAKRLVDLGSGAGFPGLVIAIARPDLQVTLVEQDQRKAAFLSETKRQLVLSNVVVEAKDIAKLTGQYDVITARALASLTQLLGLAHPLMQDGSIAIFPKGANHAQELAEAAADWRFEYGLAPSKTNAESAIITLSKLSRI